MTRRPLLLALVILLGVLVVATIAMLALAGADADPQPPSPSPSATPLALETQVAEPITVIDQAVWWRTGWRAVDDAVVAPPDFGRLTIGRFDGEILGDIDVGEGWAARGSGPPFIVGPNMGLILYTKWDGRAAELHLLDTRVPDDRVLVTRRGLYHAALGPVSGYAYYAAGDPEPGIWRVALNDGGEPELLAQPPEVVGLRTDALFTAPISALPKQVTLMLDEEESRLAIFTCTDTCVLRVIDLESGEELDIGAEPAPRELTDFIGNVVVIEGGAAFDVETERTVPTPEGARLHVFYDAGWELPPGFSVEQRQLHPEAVLPGATRYVLIDPAGNETPIDAMGQGPGQG
ncbi:MAG TPA: hypothetical protein VJ850_06485 [Candidatus Limnocylindrales bacterium]|nr:hypothetical protein [Candidatus Limnocylindrales bacterium]